MQNKDLIAFNRLTNILLSPRYKFSTKLNKSLKIILAHLNCSRGSIMLRKNDFLEIVSSTNTKLVGVKISLKNNSPAIKAFTEGKILNITLEKSKKQYKCNNFVIAPIKFYNKVYGVINLTDKEDNAKFSPKDVKVIEKFVKSISILIENFLLTEELIAEKNKLKKTISHLNQTLQLKEELTSMIIHDLKSPLSQIMANLDILAMNDDIKNKYFDIIDTAMKGCEDMLMMIQNLVDIYKFEQGKLVLNKSEENINELLTEVTHKLYSILTEKKQKVYLTLYSKLPNIKIDKIIVMRIFYNLIHNAIKYSPEEENIYIKTKVKDNNVIIEIKNTGVGIDKKDLKKIFEKFYSLYKKHDSSGLGLTFVKLAVEAHNGSIKVSSKVGEWTKFKLLFPIEQNKPINSNIFDLTL